ncbi:MAG TPA: lysylphosphatidylglycerol synthase transmembrane domain-containing protein [Candidatus Dormibacteraeota bacterium]
MGTATPLRALACLGRRASDAWSRPWVRVAANAVLGLAALGLLLHTVPLAEVGRSVQPRHVSPLIAIAALTVLSQVVRAARWMLLLRATTRVGLLDALSINLATQLANYALPLRSGEALRLWWLSRRRRQPAAAALGLIVADHAFDLGGVAAVLGAGAVLRATAADTQLPALPALLVILALALSALVVIAGGAWLGPRLAACGLVRRCLRPSWSEALVRQSHGFWGGLRSVRRRHLAAILTMSAVAVALDGLAFAMLFRALDLAVPIASAVVAQVTLLFTYLLPAAPGYVGSLEAGGTLLLGTLGLSPASAAGAMVLWHAMATLLIVSLGLVALHRVLRAAVPER